MPIALVLMRPFHTIIPGFVTADGRPEMAFWVMGGHMQHQGHVQMINRIFNHGQNPQAASDAPRWHVTKTLALGWKRLLIRQLLTTYAPEAIRFGWINTSAPLAARN